MTSLPCAFARRGRGATVERNVQSVQGAQDAQELHGHRVTIEAVAGDPSRIVVRVGERRFPARLDPDLGWSCPALPFVGHASPAALAERLAASLSAGEGEA